jgi:sugar O-acyltransferase (sialic acid O-acetyltransferase NeuD family)
MEPRELIIFGAGGFGREVASWAERATWEERPFELVGFIDDAGAGQVLNGWPVLSLADAAAGHPQAGVLATVGDPAARERMIARAAQAGLVATVPVIHPNVEYDRDYVQIADGVVICTGSILTVNIEVQEHAQINLDCTIGHDAVIGAYATLSPGVHISGNVTLEPHAFLGTGAVAPGQAPDDRLRRGGGGGRRRDQGHRLGRDRHRHTSAGATVIGIPARARA